MIKVVLSKIFKRLTRVKKSEPLHILSLIIVIFLDIFILGNIFEGLDKQTDTLRKPEQYIPYISRDIFIYKTWNEENRNDKLINYINLKEYTYRKKEYYDLNKMEKNSKDLLVVLNEIKEDERLKELFSKRAKIRSKYNGLDNYQKNLDDKGLVLLDDINSLDSIIENESKIIKLYSMLDNSKVVGESLEKELDRVELLYSVKVLFFQFLFLSPFLFGFIIWNNRSIKKDRSLQVFISSHLIVVSFIPVFLKICELIFNLIPDKLLKNIFEYLKDMNIIIVWNYLITIFAVLFAMLLIFIVQKKIFTKEKLMLKRFRKNRCVDCGEKLKKDEDYCFACGSNQKVKCSHCGNLTYKIWNYCSHCGEELKK